MFKTVQSKIVFCVFVVGILFLITTIILSNIEVRSTFYKLEEAHAKNILNSVYLTVESSYKGILFHKNEALEIRKSNLKNVTEVAVAYIKSSYDKYKRGEISEARAKKNAIKFIKHIRYDDGVGYFWINDTSLPFAKMIMHPTIPTLDGEILDDEEFNCALGIKKNLFTAFVETVNKSDEGYVDYLWPKPTYQGLTEQQPKISFVKIFKPWKWVIGTGVYIDDIEKLAQKKVEAVISDLRSTLNKTRIGKTGYAFIYTGAKEMLVHPTLKRDVYPVLQNPETGKHILEELIASSRRQDSLEYYWDTPEAKGQYKFKKISYTRHHKELDWYISSSVYTDEIKSVGDNLVRRIVLISLVVLLLGFILSVRFAKSITAPLNRLIGAISNIRKDNFAETKMPETGTFETVELGKTINDMISSVNKAEMLIREKEEKYREELEEKVSLRTTELNNKNSEMEKHIEELILMRKKIVAQEKLASLGVLSAGIAHEIKNPLNLINNAAIVVVNAVNKIKKIEANEELDELARHERVKKQFKNIVDASSIVVEHGNKANLIVQTMLNQARVESSILQRVNLNEVLTTGVNLAFHSMRTRYPYNLSIQSDLQDIEEYYFFQEDLERAIINIAENAIYAMHEKMLKEIEKPYNPQLVVTQKNDGKTATVSLKDNGCGIPGDTVEHVFNPFFTTKPAGSGTGLGMSITHDIILKHKGEIIINTVENEYTEFVMSLPLLKESVDE